MIFGLIGNQNSGKTTLFNALTGANQRVGNFPGVTVEQKSGVLKNHADCTVVDLPGIYSMSPYSQEEVVTRDFLTQEKPGGVINIVDATNLERNLYLSLQVMELGIPMVIALNMMDEVRASGDFIDIERLSKNLGVPVVPISAIKQEGVAELVDVALKTANEKRVPAIVDFCEEGAVHRAIHSVGYAVEDHAKEQGVSPRFAATKLLEGDEPMLKTLQLTENEIEIVEHTAQQMEEEAGTDREAALADMRYAFIEAAVKDAVRKNGGESPALARSINIDKVLTHKYFGLPIFLGIMYLVFYLTFGPVGTFFADGFAAIVDLIGAGLESLLISLDVSEVLYSLVMDGIFAGVGSVLSFMPVIVTLFFFLSILEDTGYMARVAFVMDRLLRKLGLSGRSIVPMLMGFGCSVPAIMATRTLSSERDRKMTVMLVPFMSCNAKVPIYAIFAEAFFPDNAAMVMMGLYVLGMVTAVIIGLIGKNTLFKGEPVPFVMELPNYRAPGARNVLMLMWEKAKDYFVRAFTVIFVATIVIWFTQSFDFGLHLVADSSQSMLAAFGRVVAPIFAPLGFNDWRSVAALITGFTAKEAVVSTFAVLAGVTEEALPVVLGTLFTPLAAVSFLVFCLLYTPCAAAMAAVKREMGTKYMLLTTVLFQSGVAWLVAFIVYQGGRLLGF